MPEYDISTNQLRTLYQRRVEAVKGRTAQFRGKVAKILVKGLQEATQEQLYDRTPLPTTGALLNSIRPIMSGNTVKVGYIFGKGAAYAQYRLNMSGISPSGGHDLSMNPGQYLNDNTLPEIRKELSKVMRDIREGK